MDAIFDCLMDGTACITSKAGWKWDDIIWDLGMRLSDIAHQDMLIRAETTVDIVRAKQNGQIAFIPSLEAATPIENELDRLDILYGLGSARRASPTARPIRSAPVCANRTTVV